jgi:DNA-binding PadR family transcriptional regulator
MARSRSLSAPARDVLARLAEAETAWHHGYDLCHQTGIKSGTLYPLLMRLAAQRYLEAEWQPPEEPGRPARHAYRLTAAGRQLAYDNPPSMAGEHPAGPEERLA